MSDLVPYDYVSNRAFNEILDNIYSEAIKELGNRAMNRQNAVHPRFAEGENEIYRPLTFRENIAVMVNDYETLYDPQDGHKRSDAERLSLFKEKYYNSCTGIIRKKNSNLFKIQPISKELATMTIMSEGHELPIETIDESILIEDYDGIQAPETDIAFAAYNRPLTKYEARSHEGWITALEGDRTLNNAHSDIIYHAPNFYSLTGKQFSIPDLSKRNELYDLAIKLSGAGNHDLSFPTRFLFLTKANKRNS